MHTTRQIARLQTSSNSCLLVVDFDVSGASAFLAARKRKPCWSYADCNCDRRWVNLPARVSADNHRQWLYDRDPCIWSASWAMYIDDTSSLVVKQLKSTDWHRASCGHGSRPMFPREVRAADDILATMIFAMVSKSNLPEFITRHMFHINLSEHQSITTRLVPTIAQATCITVNTITTTDRNTSPLFYRKCKRSLQCKRICKQRIAFLN